MAKKVMDYVKIADALAKSRPPSHSRAKLEQWLATRESIMDMLLQDSEKFHVSSFCSATYK